MAGEQDIAEVAALMDRINRTWRDRRPQDLTPLLHPTMAMVFPGFTGRLVGQETIVAGFADFCTHAVIHDYREGKKEIDVAGCGAVVSYAYEMTYERDGGCYRATGRDLWVFCKEMGTWLATWRTMVGVDEQPVDSLPNVPTNQERSHH
jgi:hypothetical protein